MRKLLCYILTLFMILTVIPVTAFADSIYYESIPEAVVIESNRTVYNVPAILQGVGKISVSKCVVIDGKSYDLYRTFDEPEKALEQIAFRSEDVLNLVKTTYGLSDFSDRTWCDYRNAMYCMLDDECCPEWYNESNEEYRALVVFFDIYENDSKNEELTIYADKLMASKSNIVKKEMHEELLNNLPYSSLESSDEKDIEEKAAVINGFNQNAGIAYAENWATSRNIPEYHSFTNGDCTNFASQILEKGGVGQAVYSSEYSGWWHKKTVTRFGTIHSHSRSWTQADVFARYMGVGYKTTSNANFSSNIKAGDFIALDQANDGDWDHIGFVVNVKTYMTNGYYDYKVAQHTSDYLAWASSSTNNWDNAGSQGSAYGRVRR